MAKNLSVMQDSIPGLGKCLGKGNDNPFQYSCLENSIDRPWGHQDLDRTEQLTHTCGLIEAYMCVFTVKLL